MKQFFILLLGSWLSTTAFAQPNFDYYWVGTSSNGVQGSGDWTDLNAWRLDSLTGAIPTQVPISSNSVFFMAAAFPTVLPGATPVEITISSSVNCKNFYWDNTVPTLALPIVFQTSTAGSTGPSNISLDIYGNFDLPTASQLDFDFNGLLRFRSTALLSMIRSNGQKLLVKQVVFEGSDSTEFRLMDDLYIDDPKEYHYSRRADIDGGFCSFNRGYLNFNGQNAVLDRFWANNTTFPTRRINIANSRIQLIGHADYVWRVNFNAAGTNYASFDATGSHIIAQEPTGLAYAQQLWLGSVDYDSITIEARYYTLIRRDDPTVEHLFLNSETRFYDGLNLTVENLYLKGGLVYSFHASNNGGPKIIAENITVTGPCDRFASLVGWQGTRGHIAKKTPGGTLTLDKVILNGIEGDISTGSTYIANNSVDAGGNINWTINSNTGRDMRFRFSNATAFNHYWHNLNNWEEFDGTNWIAASCLPTPLDDVYFDLASYPPTGNRRIRVDSVAYCHDIRWANDVDNRVEFYPYLYTGLTTRVFNVYGTMELDADMRFGCVGRVIDFWGSAGDSIITKGVYIGNTCRLQCFSDYEIAGNYAGRTLQGLINSTLRSNDNRLDLGTFAVHRRQMHNVEVNLTHDRAYPFRDYGGFDLATSYTGNTTFNFWADRHFYNCNGSSTGDGRNYLYGSSCGSCAGANPPMHLPNTIFHTELFGLVYNMTVHGDLLLKERGQFHHWVSNPTYFTQVRVLGDQPGGGFNGNMTLTAGKTYIFDSYHSNRYLPTDARAIHNSKVEVAGTLTALGTCDEPIAIRTFNGNPMTWDINATNISNTFIEGMENINAPINVVNSVDGGGNTNINFVTSGPGVTLYWRAHHSAPSNFEGIWQDPGHWTTNPASLVGDSACIPSAVDTVIFDNLSYSGASNGVTIDAIAFCKTIWIKDDVAFISSNLVNPKGHLLINESLLIDVPLTQNSYTGTLSFIGANGTIRTSGSVLINNLIEFRNTGATWNLTDDLTLDNPHHTRHGRLRLSSGTFRSNNHTLNLSNAFESFGYEPRRLVLGTSTVNLYMRGIYINGDYPAPWFIPNGHRNIAVEGENSIINVFDNNPTNRNPRLYMGYDSLAYKVFSPNSTGYNINRIQYGVVNFGASSDELLVYGYAEYNFMNYEGSARVEGSNLMDSVSFEGGYFYRFRSRMIQELRAPHGKIISRGSGSNFVNIETVPAGQIAHFHKEWGDYFCLDYIKVKDNTATKGINPNTGLVDNDLFFYTGTNSDNIGGTALGIWNFSLLFSTHTAQAPIVTPCEGQDSADITVFITGNDFYDIRYQWYDSLGNTGADTIQVNDDDNDPTTPFAFTVRGPVLSSGYYAFDIATFRCDKRTAAALDTAWVYKLIPNTLVDQDRTGSCYLTNTNDWVDFYDDVDAKPIASLQDLTSPTDQDSLKNVNVAVYLEPTVRYHAGRPYLPRHWNITPENNVGAKVRVYFTQQELNELYQRTHHAYAGLPFGAGPAYVEVWKFDAVPYTAAAIGSSAPTVVPHTTIPVAGANAKAFTNTTDVLGIEFEVNSFSHFIIVPTVPVLLSANLMRFEAKATGQQQTTLTWEMSTMDDVDHFEVLRSNDGINFEPLMEEAATRNLEYQTIDHQALAGYNYYRLRLHHDDDSQTLSEIKVVYYEVTRLLDIFPNPVSKEDLNIRLSAIEEVPLRLQWVNTLGQVVQEHQQTIQRGTNMFSVPTNNLAEGIYVLNIYQGATLIGQRKISKND
ncbi:MAG: T9SS type A sorting domain-containing protein [Aureispira sp.]